MRHVIALGSNKRHHRHGPPARVLRAALTALARTGLAVVAVSRIETSQPLGPSRRSYANAAALIETALGPEQLLAVLQHLELRFGRTGGGQRWSARVLDLDLILSEAGPWCSPWLVVPHPAFRNRAFVTGPICQVAPHWRDPLTGLTVQQLHARLTRRRALPR